MKKKSQSLSRRVGKNPLQKKRRQTLITIIFLLLLLVAGALALTILGQGNFDLRQQASVKKGLVMIDMGFSNSISHPVFVDGSRQVDYGSLSVPIRINTLGANVGRIKLDLRLNNWNGIKISNLSFKANPKQAELDNLVLIDSQVNKNILTLDFQVQDPNLGFNSRNNAILLGNVDFTIEQVASIKDPNKSLGFSLSAFRANSQAFLVGSDKDVLQNIEPAWFTMRGGSINPEDNDSRGRQCYSNADCGTELKCNFTNNREKEIGICGEKEQLVTCYNDNDCQKNESCVFVEQTCPEGLNCAHVMKGYCTAFELRAINGVELK